MPRPLSTLPILLLASAAALAEPAANDLVWNCQLEPRTSSAVLCHRAGADGPAADFDPALDPQPDGPALRRQLLDKGGTSVGQLVRTAPADHAKTAWRIPLHTVPFDDMRLQLLTEAVMCGTDMHCRVQMGPQVVVTQVQVR